MPRGELTPDEEAAAEIVAQQLGGTAIPRDVPGAGDRTHDFDIELPDGRLIPLEVTSAGNEAVEALAGAAFSDWPAPTLTRNWWIGLPRDGGLNVKSLMGALPPHLAVLERHDVELVSARQPLPADADGEVIAAREGVLAAGATHAARLRTPDPGEAARLLSSMHGGAASNFDLMNDLVAGCARRKAEKLAAADGCERHLFVWIRGSASDAALAIETLPPPPDTPEIPDGIDVVWVATGVPGQPPRALLRLQPPGGWETIVGGSGR